MKEITIPDHVLHIGEKPWSYADCVRWLVDTNHELFNADGPGIRAGQRILDRVEGKGPGDKVELADDDCSRLHNAFEKPTKGYVPSLATADGKPVEISNRIFLPYMNTVEPGEKS